MRTSRRRRQTRWCSAAIGSAAASVVSNAGRAGPERAGTPAAEGTSAELHRTLARRHRTIAGEAAPVRLVDRPRGVRTHQLMPGSRELEGEPAGPGRAAELDDQAIAARHQKALDPVAVDGRRRRIAVRADARTVHQQQVLAIAENPGFGLQGDLDEVELLDGVETRRLDMAQVVVAPDPDRRVAGGRRRARGCGAGARRRRDPKRQRRRRPRQTGSRQSGLESSNSRATQRATVAQRRRGEGGGGRESGRVGRRWWRD